MLQPKLLFPVASLFIFWTWIFFSLFHNQQTRSKQQHRTTRISRGTDTAELRSGQFMLIFWYNCIDLQHAVCTRTYTYSACSCYSISQIKYTYSKKSQLTQQYVCISYQGKQETKKQQKISEGTEIHHTWQVSQGFSLSLMDLCITCL